MRLLAYGPAVNAEPIVSIELHDDGSLEIHLEREDGNESILLAPSAVNEGLRDLVREEAAA